jgi:N-methylhydantoinase A/oxoprolinase/acetone carboxylase beta subunit
VLVPESAGVLSALGLVGSEERRDHVRSYVRPLFEVGDLPSEGEADLRYAGQSFELRVPLGGDLAAAFHAAHVERYGYADETREVELVAVRTAAVVPGPSIDLTSDLAANVVGPARLDLAGATCWVPDGWAGEADENGTLRLERTR